MKLTSANSASLGHSQRPLLDCQCVGVGGCGGDVPDLIIILDYSTRETLLIKKV